MVGPLLRKAERRSRGANNTAIAIRLPQSAAIYLPGPLIISVLTMLSRSLCGGGEAITSRGLRPIDLVTIEWDQPEPLIIEVHAHADDRTVRAVALQGTAGLKRGITVRSTGGPVTVPVGEAALGRLLDVMGRVRDNGPPLPAQLSRLPIYRIAPPIA